MDCVARPRSSVVTIGFEGMGSKCGEEGGEPQTYIYKSTLRLTSYVGSGYLCVGMHVTKSQPAGKGRAVPETGLTAVRLVKFVGNSFRIVQPPGSLFTAGWGSDGKWMKGPATIPPIPPQ